MKCKEYRVEFCAHSARQPTWVRGLCRGCARPVALLHRLRVAVPLPFGSLPHVGAWLMQGLRSPRGVAPPPAYTVPPVSRANPAGDVGLQGFRSPVGLALCHPFHGLIPQVMLGCRGFARPLGSLHRLPTLCRPFHGLIPRVMLGCRGFARPLGLLHRLPTLCRPFHGLIPRLAPPPAYSMSPVSRAKIEFMPVVARRRGYIEIFFSCDLLLILLHRLVAGVAVARKTGDIE